MTARPLPAWATTGAKVLIEPGSHGRNRRFIEATVTRTTATSVFAKADSGTGFSAERRFVASSWANDADRMVEYGNRGESWSPNTYLWNPEAPRLLEVVEAGKRQAVIDAVAFASDELAQAMRRGGPERQAEKIATLQEAITAYQEATK